MSKNLFSEPYEVNGRIYTDNLPVNAFIGITKEQYIEYEQQKEEIERLNNILNELEKDIDLELYKTRANDEYNEGLFNAFRYVKDKLQEFKGVDKE